MGAILPQWYDVTHAFFFQKQQIFFRKKVFIGCDDTILEITLLL